MTSRKRRALVLVLLVVVLAGFYWYSRHRALYSSWLRGQLIPASLVAERTIAGTKIQLYDTEFGKFWINQGGRLLLNDLLTEIFIRQDYETEGVRIEPGDWVIDCGAHVGIFARYALGRGAGKVIAIEPDSSNVSCLQLNLEKEIASGKVILLQAGVWDEASELTLARNQENSATNSFVNQHKHFLPPEKVRVRPLDSFVEDLELERVDFIKMDIEGSERRALKGAQQTIRRFSPRMAICTYHRPDDSAIVPALVAQADPRYQIIYKDFLALPWPEKRIGPKIVFFRLRSKP